LPHICTRNPHAQPFLQRLAKLEALRRPAASTTMPMQDVLDLRATTA
jgi:hypothetical protein